MEDAETMMQRRQPYVLCGFLIRDCNASHLR